MHSKKFTALNASVMELSAAEWVPLFFCTFIIHDNPLCCIIHNFFFVVMFCNLSLFFFYSTPVQMWRDLWQSRRLKKFNLLCSPTPNNWEMKNQTENPLIGVLEWFFFRKIKTIFRVKVFSLELMIVQSTTRLFTLVKSATNGFEVQSVVDAFLEDYWMNVKIDRKYFVVRFCGIWVEFDGEFSWFWSKFVGELFEHFQCKLWLLKFWCRILFRQINSNVHKIFSLLNPHISTTHCTFSS